MVLVDYKCYDLYSFTNFITNLNILVFSEVMVMSVSNLSAPAA